MHVSIFLFGSLVDMQKAGHIFVFQVLPAIIFFAGTHSSSLLFECYPVGSTLAGEGTT